MEDQEQGARGSRTEQGWRLHNKARNNTTLIQRMRINCIAKLRNKTGAKGKARPPYIHKGFYVESHGTRWKLLEESRRRWNLLADRRF